MKRFLFPLDPLLRLRELRTKQEDERLACLLAEQRRLRDQIAEVENQQTASSASLLRFDSVQGSDMRALGSYLTGLYQLRAALHQKAKHCEQRIAEQRAKCINAARDQKVLEKLRSAKMQEWAQELDREQELVASEVFLNGYVRRKSKVIAVSDEK